LQKYTTLVDNQFVVSKTKEFGKALLKIYNFKSLLLIV